MKSLMIDITLALVASLAVVMIIFAVVEIIL
jgi:hypothetical protein